MVAAFKSEWVAGFKSEYPAGFIGIRIFSTSFIILARKIAFLQHVRGIEVGERFGVASNRYRKPVRAEGSRDLSRTLLRNAIVAQFTGLGNNGRQDRLVFSRV